MELPAAVAAVLIGLGLAFLGRKIVKVLVFLGAGLFAANIAFGFLKDRFDAPIPLVGAIIAFLVLGFLSLALLKFIFGVMLGIVGYLIAMAITGNQLMAILIGVVVFVIGLILFKYYLSIATAFAGAAMVFSGLGAVDIPRLASALIAVVVLLAGAYVQVKQLH